MARTSKKKNTLLHAKGVTAFYGRIQALRGVDIDVNEGEIVTLIGANGAGKSTLMMTICGRPQARDGSIVFDGRDITRMATYDIMRLGLAQSPEGRRRCRQSQGNRTARGKASNQAGRMKWSGRRSRKGTQGFW